MERVFKNISFLIVMLALSVSCCFVNAYAASSETFKTITSVVDFSFIEPAIEHEKIDTVLANGILNAKVYANFGEATSGNAVLEYKLDSGEVVEITKTGITNRRDFYIGTPKGTITKDNSIIEYRIKCVFDVDGSEYVRYAPVEASSETFVTVQVINVIEGNIDGSAGGEISVFCGDQSKEDDGYVIVSVPEGAYSGEHKVTVDFLEESSSSSGSSQVRENVISTVSLDIEGVSELNSPILIKNLPLQNETQASKFSLQYQNGTEWESVTGASLSVDKKYQVYTFAASDLGSYRVIESIKLSDSSYRPKNRIVVKGKIGNSYPGFEFKYLQQGDSITIYDLKGKKIRKISADGSDPTVWDGRKDNGDWAESGTYIYQIKLKSGGDAISGTVAFVW
ncbi:hypothetical protein [Candidatus Ruminimicrobiellum ovillum]|uniref:hypothetical protein n=1 Tax=Candidatus Ruminimicrobiellum ovillum TaxID=1947927 RepID=UPI003559A340